MKSRLAGYALLVLAVSCADPRAPGATAGAPASPSASAPNRIATGSAAPASATIERGAFVLGTCGARSKTAKFSFAHFNDLQARYDESIDGKNRYGLIAGALRAFKKDEPATLVLDAGDDYEKGAVTDLRSLGEATRQMIRALPIDVRTIGNHDFAYGERAVVRDVSLSAHPVLAANISYAANPGLFQPYARFDVGCVKVGVIGAVARSYGADDRPSDEPFAGVFAQRDDYEKVVAREVALHRGEVDVMIALTHLGIGVDMVLASRIAGIDLVIGGHSEDTLAHPGWVMRANGTRGWVLQAGHYGRAIGHGSITVDFESRAVTIDAYQLVGVNAALPYAADVGELATRLELENAPDSHRPIAIASADVGQGRGLADLVWRAAADRWGADAMILGKDLFWDKLHAGPITLQHLYDAVLVQREPSGTSGFSSLYIAEMTGAAITKLHAAMIRGPKYAFYGAAQFDALRTYRLVIEKRALEAPKTAFSGAPELPHARFGGELIDVLESYARSRTARGLTLD